MLAELFRPVESGVSPELSLMPCVKFVGAIDGRAAASPQNVLNGGANWQKKILVNYIGSTPSCRQTGENLLNPGRLTPMPQNSKIELRVGLGWPAAIVGPDLGIVLVLSRALA